MHLPAARRRGGPLFYGALLAGKKKNGFFTGITETSSKSLWRVRTTPSRARQDRFTAPASTGPAALGPGKKFRDRNAPLAQNLFLVGTKTTRPLDGHPPDAGRAIRFGTTVGGGSPCVLSQDPTPRACRDGTYRTEGIWTSAPDQPVPIALAVAVCSNGDVFVTIVHRGGARGSANAWTLHPRGGKNRRRAIEGSGDHRARLLQGPPCRLGTSAVPSARGCACSREGTVEAAGRE